MCATRKCYLFFVLILIKSRVFQFVRWFLFYFHYNKVGTWYVTTLVIGYDQIEINKWSGLIFCNFFFLYSHRLLTFVQIVNRPKRISVSGHLWFASVVIHNTASRWPCADCAFTTLMCPRGVM